MSCCARCFDHPILKEFVNNHAGAGYCDYCESEAAHIIEPEELQGYLGNVVSAYHRDNGEFPFISGECLLSLLQDDWSIFSDELPEETQAKLLGDILNSDWDDDDGEDPVDANDLYFWGSGPHDVSPAEAWDEFCSEVRENPNHPIPFDDFMLEEVAHIEERMGRETPLFRARVGFILNGQGEKVAYSGVEIGAPNAAPAGRPNRAGNGVLYCADSELTAVAECRPARGYLVSVARLSLTRDVRVVDLTRRLEINPFTANPLKYFAELSGVLFSLGEEMSRPMERETDPAHYLPSQKLSEWIQGGHFGGIKYPSALAEQGWNLVLFDPYVATVATSRLIRVERIAVEISDRVIR